MTACHYCAVEFPDPTDLRPYGPGGASVCYDCGHATPERSKTTAQAMRAMLDAAEAMSPHGAVVLNDAGFHPFTGLDDADGLIL